MNLSTASRIGLAAAALLLSTSAALAQAQGPQTGLPVVELGAGMHLIHAEVARTDEQRAIGLMNRRDMPANNGMLFVFEDANVQCFWMRNTLIPLAVAFVADDGTIVDFEARFLNAAACALLNRSADSIIGLGCRAAFPTSADHLIARWTEAVDGAGQFHEELSITVRGERRWVHQQVLSIGDGVVVISQDVTERRLAQFEAPAALRCRCCDERKAETGAGGARRRAGGQVQRNGQGGCQDRTLRREEIHQEVSRSCDGFKPV